MIQLTRDTRHLNWILGWAVVFCDIGTSIYYVPGILYGHVKDATPFFVLLTAFGFILLGIKYSEISWRNPEGGGVVTVATKAFGPMWGCLGGMLIIVDYFLTTAISSVSGFQYLGSLFPLADHHIVLLACIGTVFLAVLNIIGIRESAALSLVMAVGALIADLLVVAIAFAVMDKTQWTNAFHSLSHAVHPLSSYEILVGFASAWLAFSGLESISQLSPAMRFPLRKTAWMTMLAVMITMMITSPILTTLSIAVLSPEVKIHESERFISELAFAVGGLWPKLAVVFSASSLLLFASNTAIIGTYHVFLSLANRGFLPKFITLRNTRFNTPHVAIIIATLVPLGVIIMTQGKLSILGDLYAFGLLGAFVFSSLGLDVVRWQLRLRGFGFWIGLLTTAVVIVAWGINLREKELATFFGGSVTAIGMLTAVGVRNGWFLDALQRVPAIQRIQARAFQASEDFAEEVSKDIVSVSQAVDLRPLYSSTTLIALRGENVNLIQEGVNRAKGKGELAIYCLYVEEWPGLFAGDTPHRPNEEGIRTLKFALEAVQDKDIQIIPIWTISHNSSEAIAKAARDLYVEAVMVGTSRRSAFYHMLRGHVVKGLARKLPLNCKLMICN
ncbi:MAG: universal stress protein [Chlamydiae bacterium]|nr:universal stress protein [Chlamydiota bacterium]MBI3277566.1 universal stress protein [Chlamydiota bacterium]